MSERSRRRAMREQMDLYEDDYYSGYSDRWDFSKTKLPSFDTFTKYTFYATVVALILFVGLVFINFTMYPVFSFTIDGGGIVSMPLPSSVQNENPSSIPTYDSALKFNGVGAYGYSISMDVFIQSEFAVNDTYPRVVFYRSATPLTATAFPSSSTLADLQRLIPNSNIIAYIDPLVNNLYVMIQTQTGSSTSNYVTTDAIKNLPIRNPFRLTVVLDSAFVEVYVNGKMETTMPLSSAPVPTQPTAPFYGPPQLIASALKISNVSYYSMLLSPKSIRVLATYPPVNAGIFNAAM